MLFRQEMTCVRTCWYFRLSVRWTECGSKRDSIYKWSPTSVFLQAKLGVSMIDLFVLLNVHKVWEFVFFQSLLFYACQVWWKWYQRQWPWQRFIKSGVWVEASERTLWRNGFTCLTELRKTTRRLRPSEKPFLNDALSLLHLSRA